METKKENKERKVQAKSVSYALKAALAHTKTLLDANCIGKQEYDTMTEILMKAVDIHIRSEFGMFNK